jgi:hypothetical protein
MFKLVAVLFAVVNGVPAEKPAGVLTYNKATFPTEEACMQFAATDAGKAARQAVEEIVAAQQGAISARMGSMKDAKADDNSI